MVFSEGCSGVPADRLKGDREKWGGRKEKGEGKKERRGGRKIPPVRPAPYSVKLGPIKIFYL